MVHIQTALIVLAEDVCYLCAGNHRYTLHQCDVIDYMSVFEIIRYRPPTAPPAGLPWSCSSVLLSQTCVIDQSCFLQEYTAPRNLQSSSTEPCWIVFQAARAYCSSQRPGKHPIMAYTSIQSDHQRSTFCIFPAIMGPTTRAKAGMSLLAQLH